MSVLRQVPRALAALCFPLAMVALWLSSMLYSSSSWSSAADALRDARASGSALSVGAAAYIVMPILLTLAAIALVATVRGRGRVFVIAAVSVLAVGLPDHVIGATFDLVLVNVAHSGLSTADQARALTPVFDNVGPIYFVGVTPFLLGVFLIPAAMWRARMVSWAPLALLIAEMVYQTVLGSVTAGNSIMWWVEPAACIAAYAWLGFGFLRYRPAATPVEAEAVPLAA